MKIRNFLTVVAMLSLLLFSATAAFAVYGVDDDVPGRDVVFPIICGKAAGNELNTLWAIAEGQNLGTVDLNGFIAHARVTIRNVRSAAVHDFFVDWTPWDVEVGDCKSLVSTFSAAQKTAMTITINGIDYYAGYYDLRQTSNVPPLPTTLLNRFVTWVYVVDLNKGFASGFNGLSFEDGITGPLREAGAGAVAITAERFWERYVIVNDPATHPDTWTWWLLLFGRNEYTTVNAVGTRNLEGFICDEEENCISLSIRIPNEVNIIDVNPLLPGAPLHPGGFAAGPKAGFGTFQIIERIITINPPTTITLIGTRNAPAPIGDGLHYSGFAWSYERAQAASAALSWDVMHKAFRTWCAGNGQPAWMVGGNLTSAACTITVQ